ncbi:MAG: methylenetetrahydrofolate reductase, partial [Propylenella sp.]
SLQSDLLGAAMLGIENLLLMKGDDPRAGDQPDAKPVFDIDVAELLKTAAALRDRGELPSGRKVEGPAPFFLGATDMPIDPPPGWTPDRLRTKLDAGAEFAQTQICMDPELVRRYTARLTEEGLSQRFRLIVGVAVPRSAKSARWMRSKLFGAVIPEALVTRLERASDEKAESRRFCAEVVEQLAEIPGVAGAHIMAPRNDEAIPGVVEESGILKRR